FIVMDLLDGEPLSAKLRRVGSLDWQATLEMLIPTVEAIMAAHAQGVVHRDLKPDNVFLEKRAHGEFEVKVLDFGIAKRFDLERDLAFVETAEAPSSASSNSLTTTHSALGTPSYMAPEQMRHDDDIGVSVDVWMLGMLAYECLTGRRPERDPNTFGVADDVAEPYLAEHGKGMNQAASALVMSMLRLDPAERPALVDLRAKMRDLGSVTSALPRSNRTTAIFALIALSTVGAGLWITRRNDARTEPAISTTTENQSVSVVVASASVSALPVAAPVESATPITSAIPAAPKAPKKSAHVVASSTSIDISPPPAPSASVAIPSYERK
ncbi:MAG: serine/threonine-protein kinase, partial [Polyangiaceae bacterium]